MNAVVSEKIESTGQLPDGKKEKKAKSYLIEIKGCKFSFSSTDDAEHIKKLENKLSEVFNMLNIKDDAGVVFSPSSLKVALLLADELVRVNTMNEKHSVLTQLNQRVTPLLEQLEQIL